MYNGAPIPPTGSRWRSRGNGKLYEVRGLAMNTTNGPADGEIMVRYSLPGSTISDYVREIDQFYERFTEEK